MSASEQVAGVAYEAFRRRFFELMPDRVVVKDGAIPAHLPEWGQVSGASKEAWIAAATAVRDAPFSGHSDSD